MKCFSLEMGGVFQIESETSHVLGPKLQRVANGIPHSDLWLRAAARKADDHAILVSRPLVTIVHKKRNIMLARSALFERSQISCAMLFCTMKWSELRALTRNSVRMPVSLFTGTF